MLFQRPKPDRERAKQNAPFIARHQGWEIGKQGGAILTKPYRRLHLVLFGLLLVDMCLRDQVLLIYGGYGDYIILLKLFALAVGIGAFWLGSALFKSDVNRIGIGLCVLLYSLLIYVTVLYITYSTVPKTMTRIFAEPTVIEADHFAVHPRTGSNRASLLYYLLGRNKDYCFMLAKQPILVSYVDDSHHGYRVTSIGLRYIDDETIFFSGQANWFGLRVQEVSGMAIGPAQDIVRIPLPADFERIRDRRRSC